MKPRSPLRRATRADVDFLFDLARHEEVSPFLAKMKPDRGELAEEIDAAVHDPFRGGRFVIERSTADEADRVGALAFACVLDWSRIARVYGVMLDPAARGAGLAPAAVRELVRLLIDELDYHRIELECYAYNERAIRVFEAVGFRREGVKRAAYWRHERWNDGVTMALLAEDVGPEWAPPGAGPYSPSSRG